MSWVLRVIVPGKGEVAKIEHEGGGWQVVARQFFAECLKVWAADRSPDPYGVLETWFVPHLFLWVAGEERDSVRVVSPQTNENRVFHQDERPGA